MSDVLNQKHMENMNYRQTTFPAAPLQYFIHLLLCSRPSCSICAIVVIKHEQLLIVRHMETRAKSDQLSQKPKSIVIEEAEANKNIRD